MPATRKNIVKTYSALFDSLDAVTKLELIEALAGLLKKDEESKEEAFFHSFGALATDEPKAGVR